MPKSWKPNFPNVYRAEHIRQLPKGAIVTLHQRDRRIGAMEMDYILLGNGKMRSLKNPKLVIPIVDAEGKFYTVTKEWEELLTKDRKKA